MILVATPQRPVYPDALVARNTAQIAALEGNLDIVRDTTPVLVPDDAPIYTRHAVARNALIDRHLRDWHTHVLWVDADLIDVPPDLPRILLETARRGPTETACPFCRSDLVVDHGDGTCDCGDCGSGWLRGEFASIVAPMAVLDPSPARLAAYPVAEQFYDIGGFLEPRGGMLHRARMFPPWFDQTGPVIELASVGCCYLIPAHVYRRGVRYAPPGIPGPVEHWSVMRQAGLRVCARTDVRVIHAWLPDYGLEPN